MYIQEEEDEGEGVQLKYICIHGASTHTRSILMSTRMSDFGYLVKYSRLLF